LPKLANSDLKIAIETNNITVTDNALFKSIFVEEPILTIPKIESKEYRSAGNFADNVKDIHLTCYANAEIDFNTPLPNFRNILAFKNSALYSYLKISFFDEFEVKDTERLALLPFENDILEITFKADEIAINAITPALGDLVFNIATKKLLECTNVANKTFVQKSILNKELKWVEVEDILTDYIDTTTGGAITWDSVNKVFISTPQVPYFADDIISITYANTIPTSPNDGDIWINTSTNNRVGKVFDGVSFVDSSYICGIKFSNANEGATATIWAVEEDQKWIMPNAISNFKFGATGGGELKFTFNLKSKIEQHIGDYTAELSFAEAPTEIITTCPADNIFLTDANAITKNQKTFDVENIEFDCAREMTFLKLQNADAGYKSVSAKNVITLQGYESEEFNYILEELGAGVQVGLSATYLNKENAVKFKFIAPIIEHSTNPDRSKKDNFVGLDKTFNAKLNESGSNYSLYFF